MKTEREIKDLIKAFKTIRDTGEHILSNPSNSKICSFESMKKEVERSKDLINMLEWVIN